MDNIELSVEFFPPQTPEGAEKLRATWTKLAALKPAFLGRGSRRDFSGLVQVISEKSEIVCQRLPAEVGLRCFTAITIPFNRNPLAIADRDSRFCLGCDDTGRIHGSGRVHFIRPKP